MLNVFYLKKNCRIYEEPQNIWKFFSKKINNKFMFNRTSSVQFLVCSWRTIFSDNKEEKSICRSRDSLCIVLLCLVQNFNFVMKKESLSSFRTPDVYVFLKKHLKHLSERRKPISFHGSYIEVQSASVCTLLVISIYLWS